MELLHSINDFNEAKQVIVGGSIHLSGRLRALKALPLYFKG